MALIERLMFHESEPSNDHIDPALFFHAAIEVIVGNLTGAQVQGFLNMDAGDIADWNAMAALLPSGSTALAIATRLQMVTDWLAIFQLAGGRFPGYITPAQVRAKVGIS